MSGDRIAPGKTAWRSPGFQTETISHRLGGNPAAADSVYTLVTSRYPKSDFAATSLYKRADMQMKAGKSDVARSLLQRIVCEYPKSTVFPLATEKLGSQTRCR